MRIAKKVNPVVDVVEQVAETRNLSRYGATARNFCTLLTS
ncbi:hypothetical protein LBWT_X1470 (plasmid) [Leptolyngbya boryana IAM M-101]|nr:hypothetical protein LBWT_X1470 [Leptolyngbya boryana IAM M-101]BAS66423.1 hypothetical protein LBDG_X1470 [Leptolyngbya boryana dg5]